MTQQYDEQNVSQKRDESSTEPDKTSSTDLNDLVAQSRQSTREAEEALNKARQQGQQPDGQQFQGQGQNRGTQGNQRARSQADADAEDLDVSGGTDREANTDTGSNIGNPEAAQGSASDGDTASE